MRVLIPTVTAGAGHLQAAAALEEAWRKLRPADEVRLLDVLDYTPRWYRKIYVKGYLKLIEHAPDLYAMMFRKPLFILSPIPGQEAANSDFLLEAGAAVKANCLEDLPFKLTTLLESKKLGQMTRTARALGQPKAAAAVCAAALERLAQGRGASPVIS